MLRKFQFAASLGLFVILLLSQTEAWSAQEVCVVPVAAANSQTACIALGGLPDWLRKNTQRDAQGQALSDVTVRLSEGVHRLAAPLILDSSVWKSGGKQLRIEGAGKDKTFITGSIAAGALPLQDSERIAKRLRQGVLQIPLIGLGIHAPEQLFEYRFGKTVIPDLELFSNDIRLPRSRWPNSGFDSVASVETQPKVRYTSKGQDLKRYQDEPALMLGGFFMHDWADETLQAGGIEKAGVSFQRTDPTYGVKTGQRIWFENALSDIDMPGEWAVDPKNQIIYLLPETQKTNTEYEISKSLEGFVFNKVWNITVQDIGFTRFRDNAIRVEEGIDINLKNIDIRNSGGVAMRLNGRNVVASDIQVSDIGAAGISLSGGNRVTLTPGRVAVRNCTVTRVGRLSKAYKAAIGLAGVGNEVSNCRLSEGPHAAIVFHGNNHLIENNVIEHFVSETDDAGAIYTGQDWTERGTVIRKNILRNIGVPGGKYGANAIYLDDQASGITVSDNIILNSQRGVFIGGGRDNNIEGNIFVACNDGVYIDSRGTRELEQKGAQAHPTYRKKFNDVNASGTQYTSSYPDFLAAGIEALGNAGNNKVDNNVFLDCKSPYVVKPPANKALNVTRTFLVKPGATLPSSTQIAPTEIPKFRESLVGNSSSVTPRESTKELP